MDIVNIADLKTHLSELINKISQTGDEVIIGKYGKPVAKLVPFSEALTQRDIGFAKHLMTGDMENLQAQVDAPLDAETLDDFYK